MYMYIGDCGTGQGTTATHTEKSYHGHPQAVAKYITMQNTFYNKEEFLIILRSLAHIFDVKQMSGHVLRLVF